MTHPHGHYNLVIGYGHAMPVDKFLEADRIKEFAIYDPALAKMDFIFNPIANDDMMHGKARQRSESRNTASGLSIDKRKGRPHGIGWKVS